MKLIAKYMIQQKKYLLIDFLKRTYVLFLGQHTLAISLLKFLETVMFTIEGLKLKLIMYMHAAKALL